eukprot:9415028-Pyramimonas_sp.AAC.1
MRGEGIYAYREDRPPSSPTRLVGLTTPSALDHPYPVPARNTPFRGAGAGHILTPLLRLVLMLGISCLSSRDWFSQ